MAEQREPGSAVHLSLDPFRSGVDALGAAVVVAEGESGVDGGAVEFEAVREGVQVGQVGGARAMLRTCGSGSGWTRGAYLPE